MILTGHFLVIVLIFIVLANGKQQISKEMVSMGRGLKTFKTVERKDEKSVVKPQKEFSPAKRQPNILREIA